jgi:hypothetical protein
MPRMKLNALSYYLTIFFEKPPENLVLSRLYPVKPVPSSLSLVKHLTGIYGHSENV